LQDAIRNVNQFSAAIEGMDGPIFRSRQGLAA
jgi:hypothetical protein